MAVEHFRDMLLPVSKMKYMAWRLTGARQPIRLALRSKQTIQVRPLTTTDYGVAYEVFMMGVYEHSWLPTNAKRIVDLGGNVGYSVLWWAARYPEASITVYEPLPEHVDAITDHVQLNGLASRVVVRPVAVGPRTGQAVLESAGARSVLNSEGAGPTVEVVDFFAENQTGRIDVLKIDIEGSEHALLADERFGQVTFGLLVMEWHATAGVPDAGAACAARLTALGCEVHERTDHHDGSGMIWARRIESSGASGASVTT
jgi:FkbM family methyltransferase